VYPVPYQSSKLSVRAPILTFHQQRNDLLDAKEAKAKEKAKEKEKDASRKDTNKLTDTARHEN